MAIAKVIINGSTRLDLTSDTVAWNNLLSTYTAHDKTGGSVTGTIPQLSAQDVTNTGSYMYIPAGYFSQPVAESAATLSASTITPGTTNQVIASGQYITGAQTILGDANLVGSNIASGVSIFGVSGTMESAGMYKVLAINSQVISVSTDSSAVSYLNSLTTISYGAFAYRRLSGDVTFPQVSIADMCAFAESPVQGRQVTPHTLTFPNLTLVKSGFAAYRNGLRGVSLPSASQILGQAFISAASLSSVYAPMCEFVGQQAFESCSALLEISLPACTDIGSVAFRYCGSLSTASFPACLSVGYMAFLGCSRLTNIFFPNCTYISTAGFSSCSSLTSVDFPNCEYIGDGAFVSCAHLTDISFPKCISIFNNAFNSCKSLQYADFPVCDTIGSYAFSGCSNLSYANFPSCRTIKTYAFARDSQITTISFPLCTDIMDQAFYLCSALTEVSLPQCKYIGNSVFTSCRSLSTVYLGSLEHIGSSVFFNLYSITFSINSPNLSFIGSNAFYGCGALNGTLSTNVSIHIGTGALSYTNITSFYFLGSEVGVLDAPTQCLPSKSTITIYIPASLVDSYKTATNWSNYASRFVGLTDEEIAAL